VKTKLALMLVSITLVLSACGSGQGAPAQTPVTAPPEHATLVVALAGAPLTLNALNIGDNTSHPPIYAIYDTLFAAEEHEENGVVYADKAKPAPYLVKEYTASADGLTYTLSLNEKAFFANGDPVDADAVVWNLDYMTEGFMYTTVSKIKSHRKINDATVEITLLEYNRDFLASLIQYMIVNPRQIEGDPDVWLASHDAGSGPYVLEKWDPANEVILKANPNHWNGAPAFARVVFRVIPEVSNHTLLLNTGEVDVSWSTPTKDVATLAGNPGLRVVEARSNRINYFTMNSDRAPFDNTLLRPAVSYAIPYDALVGDVMEGHAEHLYSNMPPALATALRSETATPYRYDLEQAQALLAEAGYADGFEFTFLLDSGKKDYADSATLIQSELSKIGIKMNIETVEYATFMDRLREDAGPQAFINSWTPFQPSPIYHTVMLFTSNASFYRYTHFSSPEVDALAAEAAGTADDTVFQKDFEEIQRLVTEEAPWAYLYAYNQMVILNKNIGNFKVYSDAVTRVGELTWVQN
jgi:peptide/nickel transport system substrate-binding protein